MFGKTEVEVLDSRDRESENVSISMSLKATIKKKRITI